MVDSDKIESDANAPGVNTLASKTRQPLRLISCKTCGHKLRFGASRCGQCWQPSPLINQTGFHMAAAGATVLIALYVFANFRPV